MVEGDSLKLSRVKKVNREWLFNFLVTEELEYIKVNDQA